MSDFDERRRSGIGGSDAAAALGISPWRTPYDLWCEKIGEGEPSPVSEAMRWGTLLQPIVLNEYMHRTGRVLAIEPRHLRHPTYGWMIGHLDGQVVGGGNRIVEAKTASTARDWGEPGTDEIPLHYLVQCHHYLVVAEAEICDVAVLIGGSDFRLYEVLRDEGIAEQLIELEAAFWHAVEARNEPPPMTIADAMHRWGRFARDGAVVAGQAEMTAIDELKALREAASGIEKAEDAAKLTIMQALGERGSSLVAPSGLLLATWKLDRGRKAYTVEAREPSRRFLVK
jgi:putative phage-type endonuclease